MKKLNRILSVITLLVFSLMFTGCPETDKSNVVGPTVIDNWTFTLTNVDFDLNAVTLNQDKIWSVGTSGAILHSADDGAVWNLKSFTADKAYFDIDVNDNFMWAIGCGLSKSFDYGDAWKEFVYLQNVLRGDFNICLTSGDILNTDQTWFVGGIYIGQSTSGDPSDDVEYGVIGVRDFSLDNVDTIRYTMLDRIDEKLYSVRFLDGNIGIACGGKGIIYRTDNAGESWDDIQTPVTNILRKVYVVDANKAFVVGDNSTVLYTNDAGLTWDPIDVNQFNGAYHFNSIHMNGSTAWVVGNEGVLFTSNDGGMNWTGPIETHTELDLHDVYVVSANEAWIVGNKGLALHYKK